MTSPAFSVIIPTFNSAPFLIPTLESVLAQTLPPHEILISDDGSTDDTPSLASGFLQKNNIPFKILTSPHQGPGATRNRAIQAATGTWIAFLDSDDHWHPEKLHHVAQAISQNPDANLICHNTILCHPDGTQRPLNLARYYNPQKPLPHQLIINNFLHISCTTINATLLKQGSLFHPDVLMAADWNFLLSNARRLRPHIIPLPLTSYTIRPDSLTLNTAPLRRLRTHLSIILRHRHLAPPHIVLYSALKQTAFALKRTLLPSA